MDTSLYQELTQHQIAPTVPELILRTGADQETKEEEDETRTGENNDKTDFAEEKTNDKFEEDDQSDFWYGAA